MIRRPDRTAATGLRVLYQAQTTEVHLRHLAWCALLHPHRRRRFASASPVDWMNRLNRRVRDLGSLESASSSWMRVTCRRSAVSHS